MASKMGNCQLAPATSCDQYKNIADDVLNGLIKNLEALRRYPNYPPEATTIIVILEDVRKIVIDGEFDEARKTLENLSEAVDVVSRFDPGDVVARSIAKNTKVLLNMIKQNLIDNLKKVCKPESTERAHPECSSCDHFATYTVDERQNFPHDCKFPEQCAALDYKDPWNVGAKYIELAEKERKQRVLLGSNYGKYTRPILWSELSTKEILEKGGKLLANDTCVLTPEGKIIKRQLPKKVPPKSPPDNPNIQRMIDLSDRLESLRTSISTLNDQKIPELRLLKDKITPKFNLPEEDRKKIKNTLVELNSKPSQTEEEEEFLVDDEWTWKDEQQQPFYDSDNNAHY